MVLYLLLICLPFKLFFPDSRFSLLRYYLRLTGDHRVNVIVRKVHV